MLRYHFLTGLKPICLDGPAPISIPDFLHQSLEVLGCAHEKEIYKLNLLFELNEMCKDICAQSFEKHPAFLKLSSFWQSIFPDEHLEKINIDTIKRAYWHMLMATSASDFIREYAHEAYKFYDFLTNISGNNNYYPKTKPYLNDPIQLHEYVQDFLWQTIKNLTPADPFSIDQIFAYFLKLIMNHQQQSYSESNGLRILKEIENAAFIVKDFSCTATK